MKKRYNFGGIKGMGKISGDKVFAPDLRKMSAHDLYLWKTKILRYCDSCTLSFRDDPKNPYNKEYGRIRRFLQKKTKELVINRKDILDIIRAKRGIKRSVAIEGVSLRYYPDCDKESEICIEYFTGNKNGKRNSHHSK